MKNIGSKNQHNEKKVGEFLAQPVPSPAAIAVRDFEPDYYYTGLYRSLLDGHLKEQSAKLIRSALKNSQGSAYDLYVREFNSK